MHSRDLWPAENISGQWMQIHPIDVVRIQKKKPINNEWKHTQTIFHTTLRGTWQSPPSPSLMAAATLAATATTMRVRRIWAKRIFHIQGNPRGADLSVKFANMAMTTTSRHNNKDDIQTMRRKAWARIELWKWLNEEMLLINEAPPAARTGGHLLQIQGCRTRICKVGLRPLWQLQPTTIIKRLSATIPKESESAKPNLIIWQHWPWKPWLSSTTHNFWEESCEQAIWVTRPTRDCYRFVGLFPYHFAFSVVVQVHGRNYGYIH